MKYRTRIYYSAEQRAEIWDRWQRGESMRSIGRVFDRQSSLNRPGFTGGQNSRRIAHYGTDTQQEDLEAVFT